MGDVRSDPIVLPYGMTEPNDDPLELQKLAVSYDYLVYRINDRIAALADATFASVGAKEAYIKKTYFGDQLRLDEETRRIEELVGECEAIELSFMKLEQLRGFVDGFEERLGRLERAFK